MVAWYTLLLPAALLLSACTDAIETFVDKVDLIPMPDTQTILYDAGLGTYTNQQITKNVPQTPAHTSNLLSTSTPVTNRLETVLHEPWIQSFQLYTYPESNISIQVLDPNSFNQARILESTGDLQFLPTQSDSNQHLFDFASGPMGGSVTFNVQHPNGSLLGRSIYRVDTIKNTLPPPIPQPKQSTPVTNTQAPTTPQPAQTVTQPLPPETPSGPQATDTAPQTSDSIQAFIDGIQPLSVHDQLLSLDTAINSPSTSTTEQNTLNRYRLDLLLKNRRLTEAEQAIPTLAQQDQTLYTGRLQERKKLYTEALLNYTAALEQSTQAFRKKAAWNDTAHLMLSQHMANKQLISLLETEAEAFATQDPSFYVNALFTLSDLKLQVKDVYGAQASLEKIVTGPYPHTAQDKAQTLLQHLESDYLRVQ